MPCSINLSISRDQMPILSMEVKFVVIYAEDDTSKYAVEEPLDAEVTTFLEL